MTNHNSYSIDQNDHLCDFGEEWDTFAFANASHDLTGGLLEGRSLWDFIANPQTRKIYQTLYTQVRDTGLPGEINFRCDSPMMKREMVLTIEADGDCLQHTSRLILETPQQHNSLLAQPLTRELGEAFITMCSWCKQVKFDGVWCDIDAALAKLAAINGDLPAVSHGICQPCLSRHGTD